MGINIIRQWGQANEGLSHAPFCSSQEEFHTHSHALQLFMTSLQQISFEQSRQFYLYNALQA